MRDWFPRLALASMLLSLGAAAFAQDAPKTDEKKSTIDKAALRRGGLETDSDTLIRFFKKRTLPEDERPAIQKLVRQLGSSDYRTRERATQTLINRGVAAIEILRQPAPISLDAELTRRMERSIQTIQEKDVAPDVSAAAVRVLAQRKPKDLVETLLDYAPFADNEAVVDELRAALGPHALEAAKPNPRLFAALTDRSPFRRALAGEVLGRAKPLAEVQKLLQDDDAVVRFRVAQSLAFAKDKNAVPILIDTLPELPLSAAWQAEDFLLRLAMGTQTPSAPLGDDRDTRDKCKAAWHAWWKAHEKKIDLAKLEEAPKMLNRTLIVLLDQASVLELGPDNQPRWQVKGLVFPLDAQMIDDDRFIVAEYHGNRVTERNTRGEVLWQKAVQGPLAAQRLPNGNTFIATDHQLLEFDKNEKQVVNISFENEGRKIMKAMKLPGGEIACMLADSRIVRYDATGKELHTFDITLGMRLFGGRVHMLPTGRVLVPHHAEGKVVEYDSKGKIVWEVPFEQPIAAVRLPNGHTMITSMNAAIGAVEVDRAGREVWSYRHESNTRVTRAIKR